MMVFQLARIPSDFDSAEGLLKVEQFQVAYVTNDADAAIDLFTRQLGVREFVRLEGDTPEGGHVRAEFAWVGTIMYEIIQASGPGTEIFSSRMPQPGPFRMVQHHLGFLIRDDAQFEAVLANARGRGWIVPHEDENPFVRVCFVEVPGLPHYLEYLRPSGAGMAFFENVPRT